MNLIKGLLPVFCVLASSATAQTRPLPPLNCTINPLQTIELSASVPGIISEVLVRPGSRVELGDVIARLDMDLAKADLRLAQARADFDGGVIAAEIQRDSLQRRVAMLETAVNERAVSRVEYESALLEYNLAISTVSRQEQDLELAAQEASRARIILEKAVIRSPAAGIIGENLIDPGENVLNRPVATIYVTSPMRIEVFVPVDMLASVISQDSPHVIINGDIENPVPITPDYVSPVANLSSNTISVYFVLESDEILPGFKCTLAQSK